MRIVRILPTWAFVLIPVSLFLSCSGDELSETTQPRVQIAVDSLNLRFGTVEAGYTEDRTIIVQNTFSFDQKLEVTVTLSGAGLSIVSGGGTFSLEPGEAKPIVIRFSPSRGGDVTGTLTIAHNGLNASSPIRIPISGKGFVATVLGISLDPTVLEFGEVAVGTSVTKTATITNPSTSTVSLSGTITISGRGFGILTGAGAFTISPGSSRAVTIRFLPSATETYAGSLSIAHNATDAASPLVIALSGKGSTRTSSGISVEPGSLDFGELQPGQTSQAQFTLTNSSSSSNTLSGSVSLWSGGPVFSIVSGGSSYDLAAGASRTVVVKFKPVIGGLFTGSIRIFHNAPSPVSPISFPLRGKSVNSITIDVSPTSLTFGVVVAGQSLQQSVIVSNSQSSTTSLTATATMSGSGFTITSGGGSFELTRGQSRTITIRFAPSSGGTYTGRLQIVHNGTTSVSPAVVTVIGTGQAAPTTNISVSPMVLDYGSVTVGQSAEKLFVVTNAATSPRAITGSVVLGSGSAGVAIVEGGGSMRLGPGESLTVRVRFSPSVRGPYGTSIVIWHDAQNTNNPALVQVRGNGN